MRYIPINAVEPGMLLATTLFDHDANILLRSNTVLTASYITRLKTLQFSGVYIFDGETEDYYETLISEDTRRKTIRSLKHLNIDQCLYLANQITNDVLSCTNMIIDMLNITSFDNYLYDHSINVATYSIICGASLNLTNEQLRLLGQAALLHDIGKTAIDINILNKRDKLTDAEFAEIKRHPEAGYRMLQQNPDIASVVRAAVYEHHENEDGSGYPRHLKSKDIHLFAKIIHVADVYDAMISKRAYKDEMNPSDVMEYLMANVDTMFDKRIIETFIAHVAPYPIGVTVELSNGQLALVIKNHPTFLARPIVRMLDSEGGDIDLLNCLNITINRIYQG